MKKNMFKGISLIVAFLMFTTFLAGCSQGNKAVTTAAPTAEQSTPATPAATPAAPNKDFVTLTMLLPGDEPSGMRAFLEGDFKQKLKDELNIGLDISYSPWSEYGNKHAMMLAAGENLDLYWGYYGAIPAIVQKQEFYPLNDLLDQYGPDLKKAIPPENFKAFTFGGKLFAIPTFNAPSAEVFNTVLVRQDLLEGVGMTGIKSLADMEQFIAKAKVKYPQMNAFSTSMDRHILRELSPDPMVIDGDFWIDAKTNKVGYPALMFPDLAKAVYKKEVEYQKKGYYTEDVTVKPDEAGGRMASGGYLMGGGALSRPLENIMELRKNVPAGKYTEYMIAPEKPKMKFTAASNYIVVGPKSKHPDRVVEFLNWIYKSKDNYDFLLYGVKGKDYTIENNRIKQINYKDGLFYEWMFRNINFMDFPDYVDDNFINTFKNWDKDATITSFYGFIFDGTPVAAEMAKVVTVETEKFGGYSTGILDVDKTFDAAVKALKDAGAEKVQQEYQKQLDAYIASQK